MPRALLTASLFGAILLIGLPQARATVLWTEDAESGSAYILDGTDSSYALIQSGLVGEGSYAFHLANPNFQDNWFVIDQDITVESDSKLFFQSRHSKAYSGQIGRVQISTNGGSSWSTNIFSEAGSGPPGEGAFTLREVDLSAYSGQSLRFRFLYDFTGGFISVPQTAIGTGWHIDNIQIADQYQKSLYSIGNPSADAQLYLEYINRARSDALVEATRLANETDSDIVSAYNYFGIDTQHIIDQFSWYVSSGAIDQVAQPLSFNANLNTAAELHTQDMFDEAFQGHNSSASPPAPFQAGDSISDRINAVDYFWTSIAENVYSYADSPRQGHAGFDVDWGNSEDQSSTWYNPAFDGQGMQNPAGHRLAIHNDTYKEVGIGVVNGTNTKNSNTVGPQLVTQDFGSPGDATFITGVVFEDLDGDNFYDVGEGRSGVRIDVDGAAYYAISSDSGGYSIPVDGSGTYDVSFTGGGFANYSLMATSNSGENVKIDYLASSVTYDPADFDTDGDVDGADLVIWETNYGVNALADANGDGVSDGRDFLVWQRNYTGTINNIAPVPEPTAIALALFGLVAVASGRRR